MKAATATETAELTLSGEICSYSPWADYVDQINSRTVRDALKTINKDDALLVNVNSLGGDPYEALAIVNQLSLHKGSVTVRVAGMAASAASLLLCVPKARSEITPGSMVMIHNVKIYATEIMDADELRAVADQLDKAVAGMAEVYSRKTGKSPEEMVKLMAAETWFTADEAVEAGFADALVEGKGKVAACLQPGNRLAIGGSCFNLGRFTPPRKMLEVKTMENMVNNIQTGPSEIAPIKAPETQAQADINTIEELYARYPQLCQMLKDSVMAATVAEERERMQELDAFMAPGREQLIAEAKYKTGITAEQCACEILKAESAARAQMKADLDADGKDCAEQISGIVPEPGMAASFDESQKWMKLAEEYKASHANKFKS